MKNVDIKIPLNRHPQTDTGTLLWGQYIALEEKFVFFFQQEICHKPSFSLKVAQKARNLLSFWSFPSAFVRRCFSLLHRCSQQFLKLLNFWCHIRRKLNESGSPFGVYLSSTKENIQQVLSAKILANCKSRGEAKKKTHTQNIPIESHGRGMLCTKLFSTFSSRNIYF